MITGLLNDPHDLPVAFHFTVAMAGGLIPVFDTAFQEVSGIGSEMDIETVTEGGENRYQYKLPKTVKQQNLKLKRGMTNMLSGLVVWCKATFEGDHILPIQTQIVTVCLCNKNGIPVRSWIFDRAYPVKWTVGGFDAMKNEIAIEEIELAYHASMRLL